MKRRVRRCIMPVTGVPLKRSDVDTDQIIPAEWLKRVERTGFEKGLFATWRDDRDFVLNDERYAGASILVAGPAFGVGSSREHAVWAIQQGGFDAVIAPSFSDIFRNNCTKNGLVARRRAGAPSSSGSGRPSTPTRRRRSPSTSSGCSSRCPRSGSSSRSRWTPRCSTVPRRPRRRRHHARPRRRDRRLRGHPRELAAGLSHPFRRGRSEGPPRRSGGATPPLVGVGTAPRAHDEEAPDPHLGAARRSAPRQSTVVRRWRTRR